MKIRAHSQIRRSHQLLQLMNGRFPDARQAAHVLRSPDAHTNSFSEQSSAERCCCYATKNWWQQPIDAESTTQFKSRQSDAAFGATALARRNLFPQSLKHVPFLHRCSRKPTGWDICCRRCVRRSVSLATNSRQEPSASIARGCRTGRNSLNVLAPQGLTERSGFLLPAPLCKSFTHFLS